MNLFNKHLEKYIVNILLKLVEKKYQRVSLISVLYKPLWFFPAI